MRRFLFLLLAMVVSQAAFTQFSIHADISPRAELRHGYRTMPTEDAKPAGLVNQRTRLALAFEQDNIKTHIAFQDVRVWGQEPQKSNIPSLAVHEAWAELLFNENLSLKIGRQELRYDNQVFFAINNWLPHGQKHDLALLKYNTAGGEFHFGTAFNQEWAAFPRSFGTQYGVNNYKYMNFLRYATTFDNGFHVALTGIADGYEAPFNPNLLYVMGTWSLYTTYTMNGLELMVNPAIQHGNIANGTDVSAYYLRADATVKPAENLNSTLGFELFSGNDFTDMDDNTFRAFNPTHGAGHAYRGYMDYFTVNIPAQTAGAGLINPFLSNRYRLSPQTTLGADFHLFFLQNNYVHQGETIDKYLGTELDLLINYGFNDFTRIIGGFSMMFGSESMEVIKSGSKDEPAYFAYIMLRIRPQLY